MISRRYYWDKFCSLQRWSFILNSSGGVASWPNFSGNWNCHYEVEELVVEMEKEINKLRDQLQEYAVRTDSETLIARAGSSIVQTECGEKVHIETTQQFGTSELDIPPICKSYMS